MKDLSIIIPIYNGEALIARCLDSICKQKTCYSWECIIVDDGSTDRSLEIIEGYNRDNIHIIRQENGGPSKARNVGLNYTNSEFVTFVDADDYWEDSYVEKTVSFLKKHQDCVAVSVVCKNIVTGSSAVKYNPNNYESKDFPRFPFVIDDFYEYWAQYCHVGTCSTTMRSKTAKAIRMREDLRVSEDYEFWLLMATYGKWGVIPQPLYISDGGAVTKSQGWLEKMQKRWDNAPAISVWCKRIVELKPGIEEEEAFKMALGRVSRNLTYCQLLSGRIELARNEALNYGDYFVQDRIGVLMKKARVNSVLWWGMCKILQFRERYRKV